MQAVTPIRPHPILNAYLDDGGSEIVIWEQLADRSVQDRRVRAEYVSWHRASDIGREARRQLKSLSTLASMREQGDWLRIGWNNEIARRMGLRGMKDNSVESFEGDVDPVMLHLVERNAQIAKPRRCYLDLETDSRVPLSRKEDMRIVVWCVTDHDTGVEHRGVLDADTDASERVLLLALNELLGNYDQIACWEGDWKGGAFDSVVTPARMHKRGINFDERRWLWVNQLAVWRKMNMQTAETGAEKESLALDNICFEQLGEGKAHAPAWVVERFGSSKSLGALSWDLWEAGGEYRELLANYCARDATLLRMLELKKGFLTIFQAVCEVCGIIAVTRSLQPTRQMDGFLLRIGRTRSLRFPTKSFFDDEQEEDEAEKFRGAVVFHPKSVPGDKTGPDAWTVEQAASWRKEHGFANGIIKNVHVCDFASLYPSVMRTWNLSADARVGWSTSASDQLAPDTCRSPGTGLLTRTDVEGVIPFALSELIRLRKEWSDLAASLPPGSVEWQDAQAKSNAYKVTANSFYGGGGSKFSRFNDRDVSEATTQNSVHLLRLAASEAERRSMVVVYGDTDSNMVIGPSEDGFRRFVQWLNEKKFPVEIASFGCKVNHIKLAFEKTFERVVFVRAKSYVGRFSQYKGTRAKRECVHGSETHVFKHEAACPSCGGHGKLSGDPEIKGVAYKRGDKGKLARELQGKIIDCLVGGVKIKDEHGVKQLANPGIETPTEDLSVYHAIISKARDHVLSDTLPIGECKLTKGISKPIREYAKPWPAHVVLAHQLIERGQAIGQGSRIEYVVVDGDVSPQRVIPADDYNGELDRFYLWERVYEPSKSLLEAAFPDHDWTSWAKVRPKKPKGKAAKVPETQFGFNLTPAPALARANADDELAVPTYTATPLDVRIPEKGGEAMLRRVEKIMRAHPGARAVRIIMVLDSGAEAILASTIRISPGPAFKEAIVHATTIAPSEAP